MEDKKIEELQKKFDKNKEELEESQKLFERIKEIMKIMRGD